ncbi:hypothetical protein [Kitasatospora sp. NA04385]|uniref:hypothetical protein n=1 Tax=Kitasatospora sp. NA04385 TaxID=2742135 RepID=UPI0020CAAD39|nr:hypothetical protein [Kitasatospora sp. NA04385]
MPRRDRALRLLVTPDGHRYRWRVGHRHDPSPRGGPGCAETLSLCPEGRSNRLRLVFRPGPDRLVPDGWTPSGSVGTGGRWLNLHEPGTVRALLEAALARGWPPGRPGVVEVDGWELFDAAAGPAPEPTAG